MSLGSPYQRVVFFFNALFKKHRHNENSCSPFVPLVCPSLVHPFWYIYIPTVYQEKKVREPAKELLVVCQYFLENRRFFEGFWKSQRNRQFFDSETFFSNWELTDGSLKIQRTAQHWPFTSVGQLLECHVPTSYQPGYIYTSPLFASQPSKFSSTQFWVYNSGFQRNLTSWKNVEKNLIIFKVQSWEIFQRSCLYLLLKFHLYIIIIIIIIIYGWNEIWKK
jgi:hypothetical protein